ncbi:hypothetical protein C8J57DRAFT_1098946 [Mycena rebaudengoi]|nr:hypothetical protein C8J57DRAFT_1098946 [Mycena rebaudengoi]
MTHDSTDIEAIRIRAATLSGILDEFLDGKISGLDDLQARLKSAGGTDAEIRVYLGQAQALGPQTVPPAVAGSGSADSGPAGPDTTRNAFLQAQAAAAAAAAIQNSAETSPSAVPGSNAAVEAFLSSLVHPSPSTALSPGLLALAPHLADLSGPSLDPHLGKTWQLRQALAKEPNIDVLIDSMQQQSLCDPVPRSIWKEIIQDKFILFPKLFAAMEPGYDHRDEPKEFHGGFSLIRKDQVLARKPLRSESDWTRVFDAWAAATGLLFVHRAEELQTYRGIIVGLFRDVPDDPASTIRLDNDIRELYAKSPFHLGDESRINRAVMASVLRHRASPPTSLGKRPATATPTGGSPSAKKKPTAICLNWNGGSCDADPCAYGRRHGACSECGDKHRAKDQLECATAYNQARARRAADKGQGAAGAQRA